MGLRNVITVLGCLIIMLTMSWRLTLVMLSVVPVLAIGVVRYGKFVKDMDDKNQLMVKFDTDGSGKLDFDEFAQVRPTRAQAAHSPVIC